MPCHHRLLQRRMISQLVSTVIQRRGLCGINVEFLIVGQFAEFSIFCRVHGADKRRPGGLVACVRGAPCADVYYIDAFTVRASDVRDDVPLLH